MFEGNPSKGDAGFMGGFVVGVVLGLLALLPVIV